MLPLKLLKMLRPNLKRKILVSQYFRNVPVILLQHQLFLKILILLFSFDCPVFVDLNIFIRSIFKCKIILIKIFYDTHVEHYDVRYQDCKPLSFFYRK